MSEHEAQRTIQSPRTGTRVCWMIAALFVVAAVYALLVPTRVAVNGSGGRPVECGTVLQPGGKFVQSFCGSANEVQRDRAIALFVGALVIAAGGFLSFGFEPRQQTATRRRVAADGSV